MQVSAYLFLAEGGISVRVEVWLCETSQPIVFDDAINAYTKGDMYCICSGETVTKFPVMHLFRVVESYK